MTFCLTLQVLVFVLTLITTIIVSSTSQPSYEGSGRVDCTTAKYQNDNDSLESCKFCTAGKKFNTKAMAYTNCVRGQYQNQNDAAPGATAALSCLTRLTRMCSAGHTGQYAVSATAACTNCVTDKYQKAARHIVTKPNINIKQKVFTEIIWLCQYFQYFVGTHLGANSFELRERSIVSIVTEYSIIVQTSLLLASSLLRGNGQELAGWFGCSGSSSACHRASCSWMNVDDVVNIRELVLTNDLPSSLKFITRKSSFVLVCMMLLMCLNFGAGLSSGSYVCTHGHGLRLKLTCKIFIFSSSSHLLLHYYTSIKTLL